MAKEKWDLGKELMQCIALAHFAVYKYSVRESAKHEKLFYDLFDPDIPMMKFNYVSIKII